MFPLSHRKLISRALLLALAATIALAPARAQLPTLGDAGDMTTAAERKLGEKVARELYRDPDYIDDPVIVEYVQGIWERLLDAARAQGNLTSEMDDRYAWKVLLGKDRIVNAFAMPGGWLGLQLGLINITASRDELASVLAHELSHVTQRHISRMMAEEKQRAPLMIVGMILGAIAASRNPEAGNAVIAGTQALAISTQLSYSRDMEREADRIGFGVLTRAGFDPRGFVGMFEKLDQSGRLNDSGNFPYLRSHPLTTERLADMQARQPLGEPASAPRPMSLEHAMITARSRVLSNPGVDGLRAFVADAESSAISSQATPKQAAALYAGILADSRLRDNRLAARLMPRLVALTAQDPAAARLAKLLDAEVALASGDPRRALGDADPASTHRPELLLGEQAALQLGRAKDVVDRLQTWVAAHPRDAAAWQLLARGYAAEGDTLRSIHAEAEAQVAVMDYSAALDRFKAAQEIARRSTSRSDHIEASIIDTRARQVESLLRQQTLER